MSRHTTQGLSLLERVHPQGSNAPLSEIQSGVEALVANGISTATDPETMASLYGAGLAGRFVRLGTLAFSGKSGASWILQGASKAASLAGESAVFASLERGFAKRRGHPPHPTFQKDWARSAVALGCIKFFGGASRSQNLVLQHLLIDTGIVAGHGAGHALGLMEKPQGSLAQRMVEAEGLNLGLKASMSLLHGSLPRLSALDRSLDLTLATQAENILPKTFVPLAWGLEAAAAEGRLSRFPIKSFPPEGPQREGRLAMSGTGGGGKAEPHSISEGEARELISRARKGDPDAVSRLAKAAETDPKIVGDLHASVVNGEKVILNILGQAAPKSRMANQVLGELASARFEGALDILAEKAKTVPWARGVLFSLAYEGKAGARAKLQELAEANSEFERLLVTEEPLKPPDPPPVGFSLPPSLMKAGARLENSMWEFIRCAAAKELGDSEISDARLPLERALLNDMSEKVREVSAIALGQLKDPLAVSSLKSALQDPDAAVRIEAARSLTKLGVGNWNILTLLRKKKTGEASKQGPPPLPWEKAFFQARILALALEPKDKKYYSGLKKMAQEGSKRAVFILFAIDLVQAKIKTGDLSKITPESFTAEMRAGFPDAKDFEAPMTTEEATFFLRYLSPRELLNYK